jgi:hypothetical protein
MDQFETATQDYIAAIAENRAVHAETLKKNDEESCKRYVASYMKVEDAAARWRELFKPGPDK